MAFIAWTSRPAFLPSMGTRLVVPLLPQDKVPEPIRKLHPVVAVSDQNLVMATHLMLAVRESKLGPSVDVSVPALR